jgi:Spy/CpxP family protein refolding chaperone
MKMKSRISCFLKNLLPVLIAVFALAFSGCGHHFGNCRPHEKISFEKRADKVAEKITKELSLTDDQKAKLEAIKSAIVQKHRAQKEAAKQRHEEFTALIKGDKIDKATLTALMKKNRESSIKDRKEFRDFMLDKFIEFHQVLTPDQRVKLSELHKKHFGHKTFDHEKFAEECDSK